MNQSDFESLINDTSKQILHDISWSPDEDHSPALEFRAEILSDPGYPLFVRGSFNPLANTLTFALIHRAHGRIYALDLGKEHHNPDCHLVGEKHKHRWNQPLRDKQAYFAADISAPSSDPIAVWSQFCKEAKILHLGKMLPPASLPTKPK